MRRCMRTLEERGEVKALEMATADSTCRCLEACVRQRACKREARWACDEIVVVVVAKRRLHVCRGLGDRKCELELHRVCDLAPRARFAKEQHSYMRLRIIRAEADPVAPGAKIGSMEGQRRVFVPILVCVTIPRLRLLH